jgi:hypothetical protein
MPWRAISKRQSRTRAENLVHVVRHVLAPVGGEHVEHVVVRRHGQQRTVRGPVERGRVRHFARRDRAHMHGHERLRHRAHAVLVQQRRR